MIGGTALVGGTGSIVGAAAGALFLGLVVSLLRFLGLSYSAQLIVQGAILAFAVLAQSRTQPDLLEARACPRRRFVTAVPVDQGGHEHVLQHGTLRQEAVILKHEADAGVPEISQRRGAKVERVLPVQRDSAL